MIGHDGPTEAELHQRASEEQYDDEMVNLRQRLADADDAILALEALLDHEKKRADAAKVAEAHAVAYHDEAIWRSDEAHKRCRAFEKERDTARAELEALRAAVGELIRWLPKCCGKWVDGSGGHKVFGPGCSAPATWDDEPYNFCDEHCHDLKIHGTEISEHYYAAPLRKLTALGHRRGAVEGFAEGKNESGG